MRAPRATYRIQLSGEFRFEDAARLAPYLARLGVRDLYASPYTKARPGSTHGYDVVDHNELNPEIGTPEEYEEMVRTLREQGMGQVLDIVPNHVGVGSENERWTDVLEHGPASESASFFDIDWYPINRPELRGKVLLPILGDHYRATLENEELKLRFDREEGSFSVFFYEHRFPLDPRTYPHILEGLPLPEGEVETMELESLATAFGNLPGRGETDEEPVLERMRDAAVNKARLARLCESSSEVLGVVERRVEWLNGEAGEPESFEGLHRVLEEQAYRLAYWRVASDEINYRRFFAINDLAGIRQEDREVFDATHRLVLGLLKDGKIDGLRIDHPDGLYDPAGYFEDLQKAASEALSSGGGEPPAYVVVEKILAGHERLPEDWPVSGTVGYEFMNLLNGLFVDPAGEEGIDRAYRRFTGRTRTFEELLYSSKKSAMRDELASELNVLSRRLLRIAEGFAGRRQYDFTLHVVRDTITEVVARFPVYRTYVRPGYVSEADRKYIDWAVGSAKKRTTAPDKSSYDFLHEVLLLEEEGPEEYRRAVEAFVGKFQQYTGPVMAKGMEDTSLYVHNRLVSLNEVGGEPERFGVSVAAFHIENTERARRWPHAMLSTSTHDTKRGEDVRARINVLSEMPGEWRETLLRWGRANRTRRRVVEAHPAPSRNDEYLLYQTLLGAWPLEGMAGLDEEGLENFRGRIRAYMEKAIREAGTHTSWTNQNEEYEEAVAHFVDALLTPSENDLFLQEFLSFGRKIARLGALNSLSQTLLKLTVPGVPDVYQGNELWDFSLVDPDNRRPVDYEMRARLLTDLEKMASGGDLSEGVASMLEDGEWQDGGPKLYLTWRALELRREKPNLFEGGEYVPLEVSGEWEGHMVAFARVSRGDVAVVVAPRLVAPLADDTGALRLRPEALSDTRIELPGSLSGTGLVNALTGEPVPVEEQDGASFVPAGPLLRHFPVSLLATS
jgi:(1->4)-alpha-D-glucan 1-alpha-D-glucosylmutase